MVAYVPLEVNDGLTTVVSSMFCEIVVSDLIALDQPTRLTLWNCFSLLGRMSTLGAVSSSLSLFECEMSRLTSCTRSKGGGKIG